MLPLPVSQVQPIQVPGPHHIPAMDEGDDSDPVAMFFYGGRRPPGIRPMHKLGDQLLERVAHLPLDVFSKGHHRPG